MKPKGTIRRTKRGKWRYERPAFGFGQPTRLTFDTWPEAIRYATGGTVGGGCQVEQAPEMSDWIAPAPRWSPFAF